jgi:hypothetical protein
MASIFIFILWSHPYLIYTIMVGAGLTVTRGFWLYFLAMINSLGTFNFFAYLLIDIMVITTMDTVFQSGGSRN